MISVLEKRYALRKELRADLDFYLKQSKEHPEYQISEDIQESISKKIKFYADLTIWFQKLTLEVQEPLKIRVFHLRYNMGFELEEIADGLGISVEEVESIITSTEKHLMHIEWFK
ncbi:sigma factor-like helix-turn-helix DNA-binding protein [Enterococcus faecalis]|uniref:sigma factor-like helix-turn-helix DNA-binding protein n=1 Tax=Enterococcus faecalis TaxID=1351 RepID=UPI00032DF89B|nr:sigma factor-like helix-turn-helix DNA-binding protein [Enterococcus faecalis]EOL13283.1 hypothetical protein WU1_02698 [Enterococcus faecalis EnGen0327]